MVGVIVPAHGFAPYLAETLDCILAQVPAPAQVVVVDDASPEPLVLHPDHVAGCALIRRESRGGPAAARESGLSALQPDVRFVALCDADDAWEDGKLAAQLDALGRFPDAALCFGRALVVGPDGRRTGERWAEPAPGEHAGAPLRRWLYEANPIPTSSVVMTRAALQAAGGFTSPAFEGEDWDWELWLRLAGRGESFVCAPDAVVRYRRHPGGLTANVAKLARFQIAVHEHHGDLVDAPTRERVLAADRAALRSVERRSRGLRRLIPRRDPYR